MCVCVCVCVCEWVGGRKENGYPGQYREGQSNSMAFKTCTAGTVYTCTCTFTCT